MKSVVLLSGGLDSAVALAIQKEPVDTLTIDYGQRHKREIRAAIAIAEHYDIPNTVIRVNPQLFGSSALTSPYIDIPQTISTTPDTTYVPARNTVFIALAAARAESIKAGSIVIGANRDDENAYPDCRPSYLQAYRDVLNLGTATHIWIDAPLIRMTKLDVIAAARELDVPIDLTWSCYEGGNEPCGQCGACLLREQALM